MRGKRICLTILMALTVFYLCGSPVFVMAEPTEESSRSTGEKEAQDAKDDEELNFDEEIDTKEIEKALDGMAESFESKDIQPVQTVYDSGTGFYMHTFQDTSNVIVNVPDGMVTDKYVVLTLPANASFTLTKDGETYDYVRGSSITDVGVYRLNMNIEYEKEVTDNKKEFDLSGYTTKESGTWEFTFQIIPKITNQIGVYNVPENCELVGVAKQNEKGTYEACSLKNKYSYEFVEDGVYELTVGDRRYSSAVFTVEFEYDTTAPYLNTEGFTNGSVTAKDIPLVVSEENVEAVVTLDGSQIRVTDALLTEPGLYRISLVDQAGNETQYTFRRKYTMNISAFGVLGWIAGICLLLGGYSYWVRTHMRVR